MDADTGKKSGDRDAYNAYEAVLEKKFKESASSSKYYAVYQARKAAHIAKKKAAESEAAATPKPVAASPQAITGSDSDGPEVSLPAWQPRKQRIKEVVAGSSSVDSALPTYGGTTVASSKAKTSASGGNRVAGPAGKDAPTVSSAGAKDTSVRPSNTSNTMKDEDEEMRTNKAKRPAEPSQENDRRLGASKRVRESSAAPSSESPALPIARRTGADREPPTWYKHLAKPKGERGRNQSDAEIAISRLKSHIDRVKSAQESPKALAKEGDEIAERLHALVFLPVSGKLLRQTRMLDNNNGLPQLFDSEFSKGTNGKIIEWPWYIKADAEELYNKWCTGEFETDLYRGIARGIANKKGGKGKGKAADVSAADRLMEGHQRFKLMDPKQHGDGLLLNGAWWPSQLAALRDGGHGSSQGSITGNPTSDRGSEVLYCGTDNKEKTLNQPSPETSSLLTNHRTKQPVRLFRSHNPLSPLAPELGFRYDGLYDVVSYEDMNPPERKRRGHRFTLVRRAGQDPIRSEGAAKRLTKQEVDEYEKDKKNRGR